MPELVEQHFSSCSSAQCRLCPCSSKPFELCFTKMLWFPLHLVALVVLCHLSYTDLPAVDRFHYPVSKMYICYSPYWSHWGNWSSWWPREVSQDSKVFWKPGFYHQQQLQVVFLTVTGSLHSFLGKYLPYTWVWMPIVFCQWFHAKVSSLAHNPEWLHKCFSQGSRDAWCVFS